MEKLLSVYGDIKVKDGGKYKGLCYKELDQAGLEKFARRAPGEADLQKFARTFLALSELEGMAETMKAEVAAPQKPAPEETEALAIQPFMVKNQKLAEQPSLSEDLRLLAASAQRSFARLPRGCRYFVILFCMYVSLLFLTSPVIAIKCGEATAEAVNLVLVRFCDFWGTFQSALLFRLGLGYQEPSFQKINHDLDKHHIDELLRAPNGPPVQAAYNHFIHELGTAFASGLCSFALLFARLTNNMKPPPPRLRLRRWWNASALILSGSHALDSPDE